LARAVQCSLCGSCLRKLSRSGTRGAVAVFPFPPAAVVSSNQAEARPRPLGRRARGPAQPLARFSHSIIQQNQRNIRLTDLGLVYWKSGTVFGGRGRFPGEEKTQNILATIRSCQSSGDVATSQPHRRTPCSCPLLYFWHLECLIHGTPMARH